MGVRGGGDGGGGRRGGGGSEGLRRGRSHRIALGTQ